MKRIHGASWEGLSSKTDHFIYDDNDDNDDLSSDDLVRVRFWRFAIQLGKGDFVVFLIFNTALSGRVENCVI